MKTHYIAPISFSLIYLFLAGQMASAGAGHGTTIFLAPFTPVGLPWVLFIAAFVTLGWIPKPGAGYVFVLLMASHYVLSLAMLIYMWNDAFSGNCSDGQNSPALDRRNHSGLRFSPRVRLGKFLPVS